MKNYRIVPGLKINKLKDSIVLENTFNGITLEYENDIVLDILQSFHQIDSKDEFYDIWKDYNEMLDELFEYQIFEKKYSFVKNMYDEDVFRIFIFHKKKDSIFTYLYKFIHILSLPLFIIFLLLIILNFEKMLSLSFLDLLFLILFFIPQCFLHELGHYIAAIANKSVVYDLGFYKKGWNMGFYVFYEEVPSNKGNIQICLGGVEFSVFIYSLLFIVALYFNHSGIMFLTFIYLMINLFNLLCFEGFDGYQVFNYLNVNDRMINVLKIFSYIFIFVFYLFCLYLGNIYN